MSSDTQAPIRWAERLSAVIACYGEAQTIPYMHQRLSAVFQKLRLDYEIIFVNNGSVDDSAIVLAEIAAEDKRVVVVNLTRNFDSQGAFSCGLAVATGDAVALLDGDLQDPPELLEEFYSKWQSGYDVIYGVRVKREAPLFMQHAYRTFYRVFRGLSYVEMPVDAGDFSLIDRRVVDVMNSLPEKHRFVRGLRAWVGYRQVGVPYIRPERMFGRTHYSLLKNVAWARYAILSFSYAPLDFIAWLAVFVFIGAFFAGLAQIFVRIFFPDLTPSGFTTLITIILFMGGIQLFCLSIIGSYLAHIYFEVKQRPPYLIENILNEPAPRRPRRAQAPRPTPTSFESSAPVTTHE